MYAASQAKSKQLVHKNSKSSRPHISIYDLGAWILNKQHCLKQDSSTTRLAPSMLTGPVTFAGSSEMSSKASPMETRRKTASDEHLIICGWQPVDNTVPQRWQVPVFRDHLRLVIIFDGSLWLAVQSSLKVTMWNMSTSWVPTRNPSTNWVKITSQNLFS